MYYQPEQLINDEYLRIIGLIATTFETNTNCSTNILSLLCHYLYPPCTDNGELRPLCVDTCNRIIQYYCTKEWSQIMEIATNTDLLKPLVHRMDCTHSYYTTSNVTYTNRTQCWNVSTDNVQLTTSALDMSQFAVILSLIFTIEVTLLLIAILLTIIAVRKLRQWKKSVKEEDNMLLARSPTNYTLTLSGGGAQ